MINKLKIFILLVFTINVIITSAISTDSLPQYEIDSIRWFVQQYQLGAPFNSTDFCKDASSYFTCQTLGKNSTSSTVTAIYIPDQVNINFKDYTFSPQDILPVTFNLTNLGEYNCEFQSTPVSPNINILNLLKQSPYIHSIFIQNDTTITDIPVLPETVTQLQLTKVGNIKSISNISKLPKIQNINLDTPVAFQPNDTFPYLISISLQLIPGQYTFNDQIFPKATSLSITTIRPGNYSLIFNHTKVEKIYIRGQGVYNATFTNADSLTNIDLNRNIDDIVNFTKAVNFSKVHYSEYFDYSVIDDITYTQNNNGYLFKINGAFNLTREIVTVTVATFPCILNSSLPRQIICQTGYINPGNCDLSLNINGQTDTKSFNLQPLYPVINSIQRNNGNGSFMFGIDEFPYDIVMRGNFGPSPNSSTSVSINNRPCIINSISTNQLTCTIDISPTKGFVPIQISVGKFNFYTTNMLAFYDINNGVFTCANGVWDDNLLKCNCPDGYSGFRCDSRLYDGVWSHVQNKNGGSIRFSYDSKQTYILGISAIKEVNQYNTVVRTVPGIALSTANGGDTFYQIQDIRSKHVFGYISYKSSPTPSFSISTMITNYTYLSTGNHLRFLYSLNVESQYSSDNDPCNDFVFTETKFGFPMQEFVRLSQGDTALMIEISSTVQSNSVPTYYTKTLENNNQRMINFNFDLPNCDYCTYDMTYTALEVTDAFRSSCFKAPPKYWNVFIYVPLAAILLAASLIIFILILKKKIFTNNERFFDFE